MNFRMSKGIGGECCDGVIFDPVIPLKPFELFGVEVAGRLAIVDWYSCRLFNKEPRYVCLCQQTSLTGKIALTGRYEIIVPDGNLIVFAEEQQCTE